MNSIGSLLGLSPWGADPNCLSAHEQAVLSGVVKIWCPNVAFVSLRMQAQEWLRTRSVDRVSAHPDWLRRRHSGSTVIITPLRLIGAHFGLPKTSAPVTLSFVLRGVAGTQGCAEFVLDEVISRVALDASSRSALQQGATVTLASDLPDERDYWSNQASLLPDFRDLTQPLIGLLDARSVPHAEPVVLAIRPAGDVMTVKGLPVGGSAYASLLRFAGGLRVNNLSIWGPNSPPQRVFEASGSSYLLIGQDGTNLLALPIRSGAVGDEVFTTPPTAHRMTASGMSVLDCCRLALRRPA